MAVTITFGLMFATVLTMVVVPVLYALLFRVRRSW
jgi:multidrug efflux pump subunit AcrB